MGYPSGGGGKGKKKNKNTTKNNACLRSVQHVFFFQGALHATRPNPNEVVNAGFSRMQSRGGG
jgi:hypothetical protein